MRLLAALAVLAFVGGPRGLRVFAQADDALKQMADAERAFAARERVVGWKQAFLEYFADDAVGFNGTNIVKAKEQIRQAPDPSKDAQLLWEPRYGDISVSGDLGWLTGPSTSTNPARDNGTPRHGNYASIWKRQPDGSFKVVMDVGVNTPLPVPFAPGFVRAPQTVRDKGHAANARATLAGADRALARGTTTNQADAYRDRLGPGARLHRPNVLPPLGEAAILTYLAAQPPYTASEHRYAETSRAGDLGYTWGTWDKGFYVRAWTREARGQWQLVLDVLQ